MKARMMAMLIGMLIKLFDPDLLKKFVDMVLDFVEDFVAGTKSTVDDRAVLPLCAMIRSTFDVPDNDYSGGVPIPGPLPRPMDSGDVKSEE